MKGFYNTIAFCHEECIRCNRYTWVDRRNKAYTCWIEGAWGSYCSYFNGKPTVNKKRDRRRPIGIGVSAAVTVPADVLANHLRARVHLMNLVLAARAHLGLEAIQAVELPTRQDE